MIKALIPLALLAIPPSQAHRPAFAEDRLAIDDSTISWVVAGEFETGLEVMVVELDFPTAFALPFEMLIPKRAANELHRPAYAIIGPGLPEPTEEQRAWLPAEVPEGMGVFIERNDDPERFVYFETVTRRTLWSSGTTAVPLRAGPHEVWVWSPNLTTGDFQLGFGVEEDFSDGGWDGLFSNWGDYAW